MSGLRWSGAGVWRFKAFSSRVSLVSHRPRDRCLLGLSWRKLHDDFPKISSRHFSNTVVYYRQAPQLYNKAFGPTKQQSSTRPTPDPDDDQTTFQFPHVRVLYLRPTIWALAISSTIYLGLSYYAAKCELTPPSSTFHASNPLGPIWQSKPRPNPDPTPTEVAQRWYANLDPVSKLSTGIIGANLGVHTLSILTPSIWLPLWHLPARNVNYTLFSSMFVHSGAAHFGFNMYFTYNMLPPVGYSPVFRGDAAHILSFFLTTGVLSGLAQHCSTLITPRIHIQRSVPEIFIRCGGASGALLAVLGVFCAQYPHAGLGIVFVPISFEAMYVLPAVMAFDAVGVVRGYRWVSFGHAAHLAGAAIGVAYSWGDGRERVWRPLVNWWKKRLTDKQ